eukprot:m.297461 g.297461  ORF g.297461 m.297461 type:complete len:55 (+) comp15858_c6_seq31:805-969(+)
MGWVPFTNTGIEKGFVCEASLQDQLSPYYSSTNKSSLVTCQVSCVSTLMPMAFH